MVANDHLKIFLLRSLFHFLFRNFFRIFNGENYINPICFYSTEGENSSYWLMKVTSYFKSSQFWLRQALLRFAFFSLVSVSVLPEFGSLTSVHSTTSLAIIMRETKQLCTLKLHGANVLLNLLFLCSTFHLITFFSECGTFSLYFLHPGTE